MRYHIVSIAAVFLALAIGVVVGSTALSGRLLSGLNQDNENLAEQVNTLQAQQERAQDQLAAQQRFTASTSGQVLGTRMSDRAVAVLSTANSNSSDREAVVGMLRDSGATVTTQLQLTERFTDPGASDQLRSLTAELGPTVGAKLPTDVTDAGSQAGALLGAALLAKPDSEKRAISEDAASAALSGLQEGGFVRGKQQPKPADLAVVVTGDAFTGDARGDAAATVSRLVVQLDKGGSGAVLAGRSGSAGGSGAVGALRADSAATQIVSTVDNIDTAMGRVVSVLALDEQADGDSGQYGVASNAQSAAPGARS